MRPEEVKPIEYRVDHGPVLKVYFVDADDEEEFAKRGFLFLKIREMLEFHFSGTAKSKNVLIMQSNRDSISMGPILEGKEHLDAVLEEIADYRSRPRRKSGLGDAVAELAILGLLLETLSGIGDQDSKLGNETQENCAECDVTFCPIRRKPYEGQKAGNFGKEHAGLN